MIVTTLPAHGTLTLGGNAVVAGQEIPVGQIGTLVFTPAPNGNGTGYGNFTFQVRDNGGTANGGVDTDQSANVFTLTVTAVNDPPALDLNGAGAGLNNAVSYVENAASTLLAPAAVLADIDSPDFNGGFVRAEVVINQQGSDFLEVVNQGSGAGQIGVSGSVISYEGVQIGTLNPPGNPGLLVVSLLFAALVGLVTSGKA